MSRPGRLVTKPNLKQTTSQSRGVLVKGVLEDRSSKGETNRVIDQDYGLLAPMPVVGKVKRKPKTAKKRKKV